LTADASTRQDESQISDEIMHSLHRSWFFDPDTITVTEENGKVRLTGTVSSPHDRPRAALAAWSHPGVVDVVNDIEVV
jgi:osmotically-inducible protein OsmY